MGIHGNSRFIIRGKHRKNRDCLMVLTAPYSFFEPLSYSCGASLLCQENLGFIAPAKNCTQAKFRLPSKNTSTVDLNQSQCQDLVVDTEMCSLLRSTPLSRAKLFRPRGNDQVANLSEGKHGAFDLLGTRFVTKGRVFSQNYIYLNLRPQPKRIDRITPSVSGGLVFEITSKEKSSLEANGVEIHRKSSLKSIKKIDIRIFIVFEIHFYVLLSSLIFGCLC